MVIAVSDYSELRTNPGKELYENLNETLNDVKNMNKDLKRLGFTEEDIIILKEPSWNALDLLMLDLEGDLRCAHSDGEETLIFFYYAGHGIQKAFLKAQLNETRLYPLEKMLRKLAKANGSFVMALFDCGRERWKVDG